MTGTDTNDPCWRAPTGAIIEGTLEQIPGTAYVTFDSADAWDHAGETDVYWDGQETVTRAGETVWCDEYGGEWLESELVKDPQAELPETIASPWDDREKLRLLLEEHLKAFYEVALAGRNRVQDTSVHAHALVAGKDVILDDVLRQRDVSEKVA